MGSKLINDNKEHVVYETSVQHLLKGNLFDLREGKPTVGRFRFISCSALAENVVRVVECESLAQLDYSAISYIWRGNGIPDESFHLKVFTTSIPEDEEPGDPISIDILQLTCLAALANNSSYIWLDRLCILQTSRDDKIWQIQHMQDIYKFCSRCFILPGGLSWLCQLEEETAWLHRAWTLQESASPPTSDVLFQWAHGSTALTGLTSGKIMEIEQGRYAMIRLGDLLQAATVGWLLCASNKMKVDVRIFGTDRSAIMALMGAMELNNQEARDTAIWRSALKRTSSRPVDMIFSIMGLFDVALNPREYGRNERQRATLDLAKGILRSGRGPIWILASLQGRFLPGASTIPAFPETSVSGKVAAEEPVEGITLGGGLAWTLRNTAASSLDDFGYLTMNGRFSAISTNGILGRRIPTYRGFEYWTVLMRIDGEQIEAGLLGRCGSVSHALVVGDIEHYMLTATAARGSKSCVAVVLLRRTQTEGHWHRCGFALVAPEFTENWQECEVTIVSSDEWTQPREYTLEEWKEGQKLEEAKRT